MNRVELKALIDSTLETKGKNTAAEVRAVLHQIVDDAYNVEDDGQPALGAASGDMLAANNISDVANKATAFANIKQAATTSATGVVELATDGESGAGLAVQANDSRLSDARSPTAHTQEKSTITGLEADLTSLANADSALAGDIVTLDAALNALDGTVSGLVSDFATLDGRVDSLETSVAGKEESGTAATLLSAHTSALNPHSQYVLISSYGTGIQTALSVNVGSAGAPVLFNGAAGTPSSIKLTNATELPTSGILDDAVTFAKMASGTAGNLISYDADGNPVAVATGSASQVLTSNGPGLPPTFQNSVGGGGSAASQTEVNAGTNNTKFVTSLTLANNSYFLSLFF